MDSKRINISKDGVMFVQTVFGNSENPNPKTPHAVVRRNGVNYDMSPAGVGMAEAGIYRDPVAAHLKNMEVNEVVDFTLAELAKVDARLFRTKELLSSILNQSKLRGAKVGVAYGISSVQLSGRHSESV